MSRYKLFDRSKLELKSLLDRDSRFNESIMVNPESKPLKIEKKKYNTIEKLAEKMIFSKEKGAPIIIAYGAHLYRNGCSPFLINLMKKGYIQQLLTNGAGIIHDFEMAHMGKTAEDVRRYIKEGQFGLWDETGRYLNECIRLGAQLNEGLGESVGKMIAKEKLGKEKISLNKKYSIVGNAYDLGVPLSCCMGIGQDIIHTHPLCNGSALGKTSHIDFLIFSNTVSNLEEGVFISIGSAVMAPTVFEKSLSMGKNLAKQEKRMLENYTIFVNDIQPSNWNWNKGEPLTNTPEFFMRFCKSFSRMGGDFEYLELNNKEFVHNLYDILKKRG